MKEVVELEFSIIWPPFLNKFVDDVQVRTLFILHTNFHAHVESHQNGLKIVLLEEMGLKHLYRHNFES